MKERYCIAQSLRRRSAICYSVLSVTVSVSRLGFLKWPSSSTVCVHRTFLQHEYWYKPHRAGVPCFWPSAWQPRWSDIHGRLPGEHGRRQNDDLQQSGRFNRVENSFFLKGDFRHRHDWKLDIFFGSHIYYRSDMIISIQAENGQDEGTGTKQVKFSTILIWDFSFKVHLLINHHLTVILQTLNYVNVSFLYTRQCQNKI